ncbi:MAG: DUF4332 domain-containing protein [Candidatus Promineifilaceae bacterium]
MTKLLKIEGIGRTVASKLEGAGIVSIEALLEYGSTPSGRQGLSKITRIPSRRLLHFVHRADLSRVKGVGEEYAELLEVAGISNVPKLANCNPDDLIVTLKDVNSYRRLVRRLPAKRLVAEWINTAQALPAVVQY